LVGARVGCGRGYPIPPGEGPGEEAVSVPSPEKNFT